MQLIQRLNAILHPTKSINDSLNMTAKEVTSNGSEMKEKLSSNASLRLMSVASGDNVALGSVINSGHKLKDTPSLVPCCEGKELEISEDLVKSGLSAISVKQDGLIQCLSVSHAFDRLQVPPGLMKHRNSFRCLHRPDLKRVPYLRRMAPGELETLFRGYADPPTRCLCNSGEVGITVRLISAFNTRRRLKGKYVADTQEDSLKEATPPKEKPGPKDMRKGDKNGRSACEVQDTIVGLNAIPETKSRAEEIPAGMRLHCARARLYTSVLTGARAGDQLVEDEDLEHDKIPLVDIPDIEDEVQLNEELQVILPPRYDEILPDSSVTTTCTAAASCTFH